VHISTQKLYILIYCGLIDYFTYYIDMHDKIKCQLQTIIKWQLQTIIKWQLQTIIKWQLQTIIRWQLQTIIKWQLQTIIKWQLQTVIKWQLQTIIKWQLQTIIKWQLQTITVLLDTPFKFYPITVEFLQSGTSDSLALDECSSKVGRFALCNFQYRYWFLGYLDLTEPTELL